MTLILVLANSDQVVVISDRRLTADGKLIDDESNKVALLVTQDARLLVGFTGLASAGYTPGSPRPLPASWQGPPPDPSSGPPPPGAFGTAYWMLETLLKTAPPDHLGEPMIRRFASEATRTFEKLPVPRANRGALFCFAGYEYTTGAPKLMLRTVSNLGLPADPKPTFFIEGSPDGKALPPVFAYGAHGALDPADMEALGSLVENRRPAEALVGKGVDVVAAAADSPRARGVIGKQMTSAILPADPSLPVLTGYHSGVVTNRVSSISVVEARGGEHGMMLVADPYMSFGEEQVLAVPRVGRNAPCPCGNGKKYKRCHGR